MTHASPPQREQFRLGSVGLAIVAAGIALRWWIFFIGRSPMDGDETIMGVMAYHMSHLERFPIYFYRQHYMGSIEVPLVALLDLLGGENWRFSVWPMRIVQSGYFAFYCWVHFQLCARFFGRRAALWILLFTALAQYYWMDYTNRLRHVTLMMAFGELIALIGWDAMRRWDETKSACWKSAAAIGILSGLAWWHYQLISTYFAAFIVLALGFSPLFRGWALKAGGEPRRFDAAGVLVVAALSLLVGALAGLSLGWGSRELWAIHEGFYYRELLIPLIGSIVALAWLAWRGYKREAALGDPAGAPMQRLFPTIMGVAFVVGYFPAWWYLATIQEEFWVVPTQLSLTEIAQRFVGLLILETSAMLEIARPSSELANVLLMTWRSPIYIMIYLGAAYGMVRRLLPSSPHACRAGTAYFLALGAALGMMHVLMPRPTAIDSPRFLVPLFASTSVALGLLCDGAQAWLFDGKPDRIRRLSGAFIGGVIAAAGILFVPIWLDRPREEIAWPWGHRKSVVEIVEALDKRGIQRVALSNGVEWVLLGYELQYASHLRIRFNRGTMGDRMEGVLDESRYGGDLFLLWLIEGDSRWILPEGTERFQVGEYYVYRLPPGTRLDMRNSIVKPNVQARFTPEGKLVRIDKEAPDNGNDPAR